MAEFIESRSRLSMGSVHLPPIVSKKQIAFITVAILIWTPFFLKKLIAGNNVLRDKNFFTHVLVRVKNRTVQRVTMIIVLLVSFLAFKQVVFLDNWKTGYGIPAYWPSSWQ